MTKESTAKDFATPLDAFVQAIKTSSTQMGPVFAPDVIGAMQDAGVGVLSFITKRVEHDLETQRALLKAKGIEEFQQIQYEFMKKAIDDYSAEMRRWMDFNNNHSNHKRHATPV